jgi:hypothetical protein
MTALFNANVNYSYNPSGAVVPTVTDATGAVTYVGNNLLLQSNTFSDAAWTTYATAYTTTPGQTDPFGGANASKITFSAQYSGPNQSTIGLVQSGTNYIATIWVQWVSGNTNLSITYYTVGSIYTVAPITVSSTWAKYKVVIPGNALGGANGLTIIQDRNTSGFGSVNIYLASLSAVTYETTPRAADLALPPTTSTALIGPRFPYAYNGSSWVPQGLLVEAGATNLLVNSGDFTTASYTKSGLSITKSGTAPDGVSQWNLITEDTSTAAHAFYGTNMTFSAGTNAGQVFVKSGTQRYISMRLEAQSTSNYPWITFDTQTNTINANALVSSYGSISYGNGVYLIWAVGTQVAQTSAGNLVLSGSSSSVAPVPAALLGNIYTGTSQTWYAWGAQYVAGASSYSSYIPTGAASASRSPDVAQATGTLLATLQGASGSVIVEGKVTNAANNQSLIGGAGAQSDLYLSFYGVGLSQVSTYNGTRALNVALPTSVTSLFRGGVSWSPNGTTVTATNVLATSDANPIWSASPTNIYLGTFNGGNYLNGTIAKIGAFNSRLTSTKLQMEVNNVGGGF